MADLATTQATRIAGKFDTDDSLRDALRFQLPGADRRISWEGPRLGIAKQIVKMLDTEGEHQALAALLA